MVLQRMNSICFKFKISAICVIFDLNLVRRQMSTQMLSDETFRKVVLIGSEIEVLIGICV